MIDRYEILSKVLFLFFPPSTPFFFLFFLTIFLSLLFHPPFKTQTLPTYRPRNVTMTMTMNMRIYVCMAFIHLNTVRILRRMEVSASYLPT